MNESVQTTPSAASAEPSYGGRALSAEETK
jgi:hypothetical protein